MPPSGEGYDYAHRLAGGVDLRLAVVREHRCSESAGCNSDGKRGATADDLCHDAASIVVETEQAIQR